MANDSRKAVFHRQVKEAVRCARQHARAGRSDVAAVIDVAYSADEVALVYACLDTGDRSDEESRRATKLLEHAVLGRSAVPAEWVEYARAELQNLARRQRQLSGR